VGVTDDFLIKLILMFGVPGIAVVGGFLVTEYLRAGMAQAMKLLLAVLTFGLALMFGVGLFMVIYEPSAFHGDALFWTFLIASFLLLRRPVY
jgi:hypothetical protein